MKLIQNFLKITFLISLILAVSSCEKQDSLIDDIAIDQDLKAVTVVVLDQSTIDQINYLNSLIEEIEALVDDGQLNRGNANSLIVKIENTIKSLEKGNDNAASNQLGAFINEVDDFVEGGIIPEEIGTELVNKAENYELLSEGSFIDPRDGQEYKIVLIGDQIWMAENLRATKYNDGADIPLVLDDAEWTNLTTPAYSWFQNDESTYGILYGALYNWFAVETGKLSPIGWHVPTNDEFATLVDYLENNGYGYEGSGNDVAKSIASSTGWSISSVLGSPGNDQTSNNSSGFSGLPGGLRGGPNDGDGMFYGLGYWAMWWTASEYTTGAALDFRLRNNGSNPWFSYSYYRSSYYKEGAEYVRCIKD